MLLIVACTQYSLVKGERIIRFVLTAQLLALNRCTWPLLCSQSVLRVLFTLPMWCYLLAAAAAAQRTTPHLTIRLRLDTVIGRPHSFAWKSWSAFLPSVAH